MTARATFVVYIGLGVLIGSVVITIIYGNAAKAISDGIGNIMWIAICAWLMPDRGRR